MLFFKNSSVATFPTKYNIMEDITRSDQFYSVPFLCPNIEVIYACDLKMFFQAQK